MAKKPKKPVKPAAKPAKPAPKAAAKAKPAPAPKTKAKAPAKAAPKVAVKVTAKAPIKTAAKPAPVPEKKSTTMERPSKKTALRDSILKRKASAKPIAFSLDKVRAIAKTTVEEAETEKSTKTTAKPSAAKQALALDKAAKPSHVKAASLADILGFNPKKAKSVEAALEVEVPRSSSATTNSFSISAPTSLKASPSTPRKLSSARPKMTPVISHPTVSTWPMPAPILSTATSR